MSQYEVATILISVSVVIIPTIVHAKSYKNDKEKKWISTRRMHAEQFGYYSNLLHKEFSHLKEEFSELSIILCKANDDIAHALDRYDSRTRPAPGNYQISLRHLYIGLHRSIGKAFEHELLLQAVGNIYWRLCAFNNLDEKFDFKNDPTVVMSENEFESICNKKSNCNLERTLLRTSFFRNYFAELNVAISEERHLELYNQVILSCEQLTDSLIKLMPTYKKAYKILEDGLQKNGLEEFKLQENCSLFYKYKLLMSALEFLIQVNLTSFKNSKNASYRTIGKIIYMGAWIEIMDRFIDLTKAKLGKNS